MLVNGFKGLALKILRKERNVPFLAKQTNKKNRQHAHHKQSDSAELRTLTKVSVNLLSKAETSIRKPVVFPLPKQSFRTPGFQTKLKYLTYLRCSPWRRTLLHCWWQCKLVQPLWKIVRWYLRKLKIELPYDPAIPLLGIYLEKTIIGKDTCTPVLTAALFTTTKTCKQSKCPLTKE